jgi:hypothetical protein
MDKPSRPISAEMKAKAAAKLNDPRVIERHAMMARITARGPLSFAIVEHPLPDDVVAIVRLGQPGPTTRYAVVSSEGFDDAIVQMALGAALSYESSHEEDTGPVSIVVRNDGSANAQSQSHGAASLHMRVGKVADLGRQSKRMLANRHLGRSVVIDGVGAAVMVPFPDAHMER